MLPAGGQAVLEKPGFPLKDCGNDAETCRRTIMRPASAGRSQRTMNARVDGKWLKIILLQVSFTGIQGWPRHPACLNNF